MRCHISILSLVLVLGGCIAARTDPTSEPSTVTVSGRSPQATVLAALTWHDKQPTLKVLIAELEQHRSHVAGSLQDIINQTLNLLRKYDAAPSPLSPQDRQQSVRLMLRLAEIYPRDFEIQLATAAGIFRLETGVREETGSLFEPASSSRTSISRAEALVANFPNEARAHAHLGDVLASDSQRALAAMRAYVRCNQLDPRQKTCQSGFDALADDWLKPRCAGFKDQAFAVHAAYSKQRRDLRRINVDGTTVFMEQKPALTGHQIQDVNESGSAPTASPSNSWILQIGFTPSAAGRFSDLTRKLSEQSGYLVVRMGKDLVAAPRVLSAIDSGTLVLTASKPLPWRGVCTRFETRKLPLDLARYRS